MRPTAPAQGKCWWGPWLSMRPQSQCIKVLSSAGQLAIRSPLKHGDPAHIRGPHKLHPRWYGQCLPGLLMVPGSFLLLTPSENPPPAQGDDACGTCCLRRRAHLQAGEAETGVGKPPQPGGAAAADPGGRSSLGILSTLGMCMHVNACIHTCVCVPTHGCMNPGSRRRCLLVHLPSGTSVSRMKKRKALNRP